MSGYVRTLALLCGLMLGLLTAGGAAPVAAVDTPPPLADVLADACADAQIPGCVLLLDYPDGRREAAAWGLADVERGAAMQPGDLLRAGSVTKTYLAVLALRLAAEGHFGLDDPAADYVGLDNHYLKLAADPGAVTIRHLLAHQSGIPDTLNQLRDSVPWLLDLLDGDGRLSQNLPQLAGGDEPFAPGTLCRYSNTGYLLLGEVLEAATGRSLATLLYHHIYAPLDLTETYYAATERTPPQARGYVPGIDGGFSDVTLLDRPEVAGAAGAVLVDANDLADFGRALFSGMPDQPALPALLTPEQLEEMMDFRELEGGGEYGLGLMRFKLGGRTALGHSGATVGYRAELMYFPDTGVIAVALANCGQAPLKRIIDAALDSRGI